MPPRFRLALVGIDHPHGAAWRRLLVELADEIEVVAIVPGFAGTTASLEERFATVPRFESVDQLLGGAEFDGALVALANDETPAAVGALARAGRHVLVEKPLAATAAAAEDALSAVEQSGVAFASGYMWRYDEAARRLRRMVIDGQFGRLINIETMFVTSDVVRRGPDHYLFNPAKSGGGFFNWLACHWLDLLLYVTGQAVVAVTARTGVFGEAPLAVEDGGCAILELEGGALATFIGGYWLPRWAGESRWTIRGSQRWVHWDPARRGTGGVLEIHGPQPHWHAMEDTLVLPADASPGYGGARGIELVRDWLASARGALSGQPVNTPASALATLQLLDAIALSSREGRRVECRIG